MFQDLLYKLGLGPAGFPDYGFGQRVDGTNKGLGYFGLLARTDGGPGGGPYDFSSELSATYDHNGKQYLFPLITPNSTPDELRALLSGGKITDQMYDKAFQFGMSRVQAGKSPFAGPGDQQLLPPPGIQPYK
jgi:hypothetical protein